MINTLNSALRRFKLFIFRYPPPGGYRFWVTLLSLTFVLYTLCSNSGKLTEVITNAHHPEGDKGSEISPLEKKEINAAITELENKILKLKKAVDLKKI